MTRLEPAASAPTSTDGVRVDDRWVGRHGIGRYAAEVVSRLALPWVPLGLDGSPSAPLDFLRRLPGPPTDALVYSPGYNALSRARRQVLTVHDLIHLEAAWPGRAKYLAYYNGPVRRTVRRGGVVITDSQASVDAIRRWVRDDAVAIVNAGVGCSPEFQVAGVAETADEPYVFYVGNLRPHKNLEVVLRAVASDPHLRLRALLPAAEHAEATRRIAAFGAGGRVALLAELDDARLAELYRGAAATVMPSMLEGFGLPPLESVRCGTPVVYWAGCAPVAETVGDRGFAVADAHDPGAWREALVDAVTTPRRVEPPDPRLHDWDRTAALVTQTLREAIDHG